MAFNYYCRWSKIVNWHLTIVLDDLRLLNWHLTIVVQCTCRWSKIVLTFNYYCRWSQIVNWRWTIFVDDLILYIDIKPVMWIRIRIRSDPDSFGSMDPDSESGSGSRGIKSLRKWREKQSLTNKNIFFSQEIIFFLSEPKKK